MTHEMWNKVLSGVQTKINKQSYDMWFQNTSVESILDKTVRITVPDDVSRRHIADNYQPLIVDLLRELTGEQYFCEFVIANGHTPSPAAQTGIPVPDALSTINNPSTMMLNPRYTFSNFVVGPNNQFAHAAAVSVSKSPGNTYNPLFLYGGVGLGKTHLMQAIGHSVMMERPFLKVLYVQCELFINDFINSLRTKTLESFKIKYREVDLLLIDDIQFLEGKEQTQEEFFHTFNTLHQSKKQIVVSSDRPPKDLSTLEDRLKTRFAWGLITDIQQPNLETREAILRNKAESDSIHVPDEVITFIATRIKSNIRYLESALNRLRHVSETSNEPISIQHAKTHIKDLFDAEVSKAITINDIMKKVSEKYDVTVDDLRAKGRHSKIVLPRFIAMYLVRKLTSLTTTEIGKEFGDRDHSTVLNAMNNVEKMIKDDPNLKEEIDELIIELKL